MKHPTAVRWTAIPILVALEAFAVLVLAGVGNDPVQGGDATEYARYAVNLAHHGVFSEAPSPPLHPSVIRSPGYPAFLAILEAVSHSVVLVQIAQFALLAITALAVYAIGRRVADERTGLVAGLLCASYLPLVWYATYHLTEITACLCVTATVLAVLWARTGPTWAWAAVGLSLAAATYVRPGFLFAPLLIAAATLIENRKDWQAPAVTLAVFALAVAPWTARNYHLTGRVIPMAATSGASLFVSAEQYRGNISYKITFDDWHRLLARASRTAAVDQSRHTAKQQVAADDALRRRARRTFDQLSAADIARSLPKRIAYLWGTADAPPHGRHSTLAHRAGQGQFAILVALGVAGLWVRRRRLWADWPLWIIAVYLTGLHLVFPIEGRYTLPARPALLVYAAVALLAAWRIVSLRASSSPTKPASSSLPS